MNGQELYELMRESNNIQDIINTQLSHADKGNIYEKLWNIIIKLGFSNMTSNIKHHIDGNINIPKTKAIDNMQLHIQSLNTLSKGLGGASDITFQESSNTWVFISSKFYLDDSKKSIDDYDVEKLLAIQNEFIYKYQKIKIILLVNDKVKVLRKIKLARESNDYIKNNIYNVFDLLDLERLFTSFKSFTTHIDFDKINLHFGNVSYIMNLRFHQKLIIHKQMQQIKLGEKNFLIGAKARSGKTYCIGGLLHEYNITYEKCNALIITPAPTETMNQFTTDLFHKFNNFVGMNIVEIRDGEALRNIKVKDKNIIIVSKQLLDDAALSTNIRNLNLNFIIIDECHFHCTTDKSLEMIKKYESKNTIKIFVTATYFKPLTTWSINKQCQHYWDIYDEQLCKNRDVKKLIARHGEYVTTFDDEDFAVYDNMPDLHILTNLMDLERHEVIRSKISDTPYGFSNSALLSTNKDGTEFNYVNEVDTILKYIAGTKDVVRDEKAVFERIKKISSSKNSRTNLTNNNFTSQLWFLPYGKEQYIDKVSECLAVRMKENEVLKDYEILIVNSKLKYSTCDIKTKIKNVEQIINKVL